MKNFNLLASTAIAASLLFAAPAFATIVNVTATDGSQGWVSPPGENSGGGSATITSVSHDGDGALAVTGDRSRFTFGDMYGTSASTSLGTVSQFADFSFSYMVDPLSTTALDPLYSPALRLVFVNDSGVRDELVYEAAYQPGGYGSTLPNGSWITTNMNSTFWLKSNNPNGENINHSITDWSTTLGNNKVVGFYVGVGSSASSNYLAHVDQVIGNGTTYNFALPGGGAVPEPSSWALMILGFGGAGSALRSRRRKVAFA